MIIIVGLGNIGEKYKNTRHNIGFMILDALANTINSETDWQENTKFEAFTKKIKIEEQEILLAKPTTYMNLSGNSVIKLLNFYKAPLKNLIIIYDDIDLSFGKHRFREEGSAGTHNGMRSIISTTGSDKIKRLRLGIENRTDEKSKKIPLENYVLSSFTEEEQENLKNFIEEANKELLDRIKIIQ